MNNPSVEAREFVIQARDSLRRGDKAAARQLGEQAALLAPDLEDAWLVLAASDPDPEDALAYAQKALQLSPHSTRAQRAVEWATGRRQQVEALVQSAPVSEPIHAYTPAAPAPAPPRQAPAAVPRPAPRAAVPPAAKPQGRRWLLPAVLTLGLCLLLALLVGYALTRLDLPALFRSIGVPVAAEETLWAPVDIAKPEEAPADQSAVVAQAEDTPVADPTEVPPTASPTDPPPPTETAAAPTQAPTLEPAAAPTATETPGSMVMEIVEDTPVSEYVPESPALSMGNGVRWIDVDLTNQMVYAYEGDVVVNSFLVSTGTWLTPTVTGKHKIYVKVRMQDMSGPGYHLRNVPWVMFFYGDYGLHGTYWHNNFGTPMSRGCVNLTIDDAAWLFNWASVGTVVNVHY